MLTFSSSNVDYMAADMLLFNAIFFSVLYVEAMMAASLEEEPADTSATVGMSVSLRCVVSDWASATVFWYFHRKQVYISRDRAIMRRQWTGGDRFSILGDAHAGEYVLNIRNVSAEDEGLYACLLFEDNEYSVSSRNALLEVFPVPNHSFPVCSIVPDVTTGGSGPGDWIVAKCVAEGGTRLSRLDWIRDFEILPGSYLAEEEPKALYEFRLTEFHNGAVFSCIETNPGWEHERSCSVMPFYYKTNVTLSLDNKRPIVGDDVTLKCDVEAMPMHGLNYTWLLNGDVISRFSSGNDNRFYFVNDYVDDYSLLTLRSVNSSLNNSVIECNVINIIELEGRATAPLKLWKDETLAELIPVDTDSQSNRLVLALILGVVIPCLLFIIVLLAVLSYRRRRVGIFHLLKDRRTSQRHNHSQRYTVHHRYVERPATSGSLSHDTEAHGLHAVLICTTPREAIQEHAKELKRISSMREHPTDKDGYLQPAVNVQPEVDVCKPRGRSRPTISGPISVVLPELTVALRDLATVHDKDTVSVDEDYVSDADTEWDL